ncbi:MAG: enoyl-CoA hydratase/isomerase family protein [Deltaproteobacteria bacterium]|nr:enoyl-CoA hydratase/isomerase family protein [Deltaproteobacteria bacterium]
MAIHFETHGKVALITIDRVHAKNSLDMEHFGELANAWIRFRDDESLWTAIITGKEDVFCVGADLKSFVPMVTDNIDDLASGEKKLGGGKYPDDAPLVAVLRDFELYKPVIAAINGTCAAGGLEMLHGMDLRFASEKARFCVAEARRGLFPGGGTTVYLPRHIGFVHAMEMLLTADYIDAQRAYDFGIVNRVVPHEKLLETAFEFAEKINKNGPCAIRAIKESVLTGLKKPLQEALNDELFMAARVFSTEDAMEGPRAFAEKRPPEWKGR